MTFALMSVAAVISVAILSFLLRAHVRKKPRGLRIRPIVCRADATLRPYPYVQVDADGSVRELCESEREYLETPFYPTDGARPYVKGRYSERNAMDEISGFLARSDVPRRIEILPAKDEGHGPKFSRFDEIVAYRNSCAEVIEHEDGSLTVFERRQS